METTQTKTKEKVAEKVSVIYFLTVGLISLSLVFFSALYTFVLPRIAAPTENKTTTQTNPLNQSTENDYQFLTKK